MNHDVCPWVRVSYTRLGLSAGYRPVRLPGTAWQIAYLAGSRGRVEQQWRASGATVEKGIQSNSHVTLLRK